MIKRGDDYERPQSFDDPHDAAPPHDDALIVFHPRGAVARADGTGALEAELEAACEYILAIEGDAGIDRIFAVVTRTVGRRIARRP